MTPNLPATRFDKPKAPLFGGARFAARVEALGLGALIAATAGVLPLVMMLHR